MAKELILKGLVQGVFCRKYCSDNAKKIRIDGSVSNLGDGTVQVVLDCDDNEKIQNFIRALKHNPHGFRFYGRIESIEQHEYSGPIRGDYVF